MILLLMREMPNITTKMTKCHTNSMLGQYHRLSRYDHYKLYTQFHLGLSKIISMPSSQIARTQRPPTNWQTMPLKSHIIPRLLGQYNFTNILILQSNYCPIFIVPIQKLNSKSNLLYLLDQMSASPPKARQQAQLHDAMRIAIDKAQV